MAGRPAIGVGSSTPLRTMRSLPPRSVTRMPPSGRNAIDHGWFSPLVTVILIGRTRPVSSEMGPSGIGGDGQLIGGGAVALPRPAAGAWGACSPASEVL